MTPTIGKTMPYRLTAEDAEAINRRREHAQEFMKLQAEKGMRPAGVQFHVGNVVREGDEFPMMIVKVWHGDDGFTVNGQLFLDGADHYWVRSLKLGGAAAIEKPEAPAIPALGPQDE